ncbi:MAG TPA: hypothetical protein VLS88_07050 [Polyangiales bacterium]|nr:hypothetical protein [Polyangiales bacterium]
MRPKSQWTPDSIVLWLIAAIAATLIVCSQLPSASGPPPEEDGANLDIEIVD